MTQIAEVSPPDRTAARTAAANVSLADVERVGPGTLNGRYLRRFWQPVLHSADLGIKQIRPIRILGEDFVVYRGEGGAAQVMAPRCPHRAMSFTAGWIEGDSIRCFYHGWRFDKDGACVEQPAEKNAFCKNVRTASYPTREYLGLVFAYLGEGAPPEFPVYPAFEEAGVSLHTDSYTRQCGFFNNMENSGDLSHIAFAHQDASVSWDESSEGPQLSARETDWGVQLSGAYPDGRKFIGQLGMPNIYHIRGVPDDIEVDYREFIGWWVPHDDSSHTQFTVVRMALPEETRQRYYQRRNEMLARHDIDREATARKVLAGEMRLEDVDPARVNMIFLQDDVAQMGVGPIDGRQKENLGRGDSFVQTLRRLYVRELTRFAGGEAVKDWQYDPAKLPVHAEFKRRF